MLKSKKVGDTYQNVYFSNLKILSTTRHNTITEIKLDNIDSALRDIQAEVCDPDSPAPEVELEQLEPSLPEEELVEEEEEPTQDRTPLPILMSIQYHDVDNMVAAVEGFLRDYRDVDGQVIESVQTCHHCLSTEMQHAGHIAEISHWRKSLMAKLNLHTRAHF